MDGKTACMELSPTARTAERGKVDLMVDVEGIELSHVGSHRYTTYNVIEHMDESYADLEKSSEMALAQYSWPSYPYCHSILRSYLLACSS